MEEQTQTTTAPVAPTQNYAIPFAIVIAGLAIAGAIYFSNNKGAEPLARGTASVAPITKEDHLLGNPQAKIIIVEYSDTECPFCKTFHPTMQKIMSEYGESGKVAWVYRHFPLPFHKKALKEAEATECAANLGGNTKFWEYINKVFEVTKGNDSLDEAELPKIAGAIGLDVTAFNTCLSSGKMKETVDKQLAGGMEAGVNATPWAYVFIDGKVAGTVEGAQPYESLKASIDNTLKK